LASDIADFNRERRPDQVASGFITFDRCRNGMLWQSHSAPSS
jgi:hypothetical protein